MPKMDPETQKRRKILADAKYDAKITQTKLEKRQVAVDVSNSQAERDALTIIELFKSGLYNIFQAEQQIGRPQSFFRQYMNNHPELQPIFDKAQICRAGKTAEALLNTATDALKMKLQVHELTDVHEVLDRQGNVRELKTTKQIAPDSYLINTTLSKLSKQFSTSLTNIQISQVIIAFLRQIAQSNPNLLEELLPVAKAFVSSYNPSNNDGAFEGSVSDDVEDNE